MTTDQKKLIFCYLLIAIYLQFVDMVVFYQPSPSRINNTHDWCLLLMQKNYISLFLIGIQSMQGSTATTRHGVNKKKIKAYRKSLYKEPNRLIRFLLILDLKPLRS